MERNKTKKHVLALALALACSTAPVAMSQDAGTNARAAERADDDRDFGWIGLLGLVGLAGLMGRKRDTYDTTHRTTTAR